MRAFCFIEDWHNRKASTLRSGVILYNTVYSVNTLTTTNDGGISAEFWPTPRVQSGTGTGPSRVKNRVDLQTAISGDSDLHLNPAWVEWLMGYPEGWTDISKGCT